MEKINHAVLEAAMDYEAYRKFSGNLLSLHIAPELKTNYSEAMLGYTQLNNARMDRLDKTTTLTEAAIEQLSQIKQPIIWLTITEPWCGDAAQIIPVLHKLAQASQYIKLRLILRDLHLDIMDRFLTHGARSIPKIITLDAATLEVLGSWGPRPAALHAMMMPEILAMKEMTDASARKERYQAMVTEVQRWYNKDRTRSTQDEILDATLKAIGLEVE